MGISNSDEKLKLSRAGILFFIAGCVILMGIITAESFYPENYTYTTSKSMISDLGATEPPNSIITQPSSTIFNWAMVIAGILVILGTYFVFCSFNDKIACILMGLLGIGALGVGVFPGNINPQHPIFALTTFISGGLAAIYSYRMIKSPLKFLVVIFGVISLVSLFANSMFVPIIGEGGIERWVAYPIVLWLLGFGGYLMGRGGSGENK